MTTQTTPQKSSFTQRLRPDSGRSVGVTTAIWINLFYGHINILLCIRLLILSHIIRTTIHGYLWNEFKIILKKRVFFFWVQGELIGGLDKATFNQTADQSPTTADQFLLLGRVWSGKKLPALIEERIYPDQPPLYPWCTHAQILLFTTYPRPSGWPIPALHDQSPTYSWCNYAHYAQYRTNPRSDFNSRPQMNNSSKCNANRNVRMAHIVN